MSRLLLVRHGQARAFEDDSDRLSETGAVQSRRFGTWLAAHRPPVDEIRCGTLLRHRQTVDAIREAFPALPPTVLDERWNEFDSTGVLGKVAPQLEAGDSTFAALAAAARAHRQTPEANRHFQRMFEVLMTRWIAGEANEDGVESWTAFQQRVGEGLHAIVNATGEGRTVLVIASGGSIATAVQTVLHAPARTALELNWRMRNASLTELLYSRGRVTLDLFNSVEHLEPDEVSYR